MVGEKSSADGCAIRYLDTASTYDLWAQHYDNDGNFLTALDSKEMVALLPHLLSMIRKPKPWKLVDLGCGTGRSTTLLLDVPQTQVVALDLSPKMLDIARERVRIARPSIDVVFEAYDMLAAPSPPAAALGATVVVSTLVVEHIPLPVIFQTVSNMLVPEGLLLLTNMHSDMGKMTQAGFIDPQTGQRIRPTSYAHSVEEIVSEAHQYGFEVAFPFKERALTKEDIGLRGSKYIGIQVWYGGILRKRL
ncbi:unnamed protein product [Discula destructiva]